MMAMYLSFCRCALHTSRSLQAYFLNPVSALFISVAFRMQHRVRLPKREAIRAKPSRMVNHVHLPANQHSFETLTSPLGKNVDSIGFVFRKGGGLTGVDLDGCIDVNTGHVEEWAQEIVSSLHTYTEISISGTGIHLIVNGTLPGPHRRKGQIEMYDAKRFFVVTGNRMGEQAEVQERQSELNALYGLVFSSRADEAVSAVHTHRWYGFPPHNFERAVQLLGQHNAHQLMRHGHSAEGELLIGTLQHFIRQAQRAADHEGDRAAALFTILLCVECRHHIPDRPRRCRSANSAGATHRLRV